MSRLLSYAPFAVVAAAQLAVPAWMIYGHESMLRTVRSTDSAPRPSTPTTPSEAATSPAFENSAPRQPSSGWSEGQGAFASRQWTRRLCPRDARHTRAAGGGDFLEVRVNYETGGHGLVRFPIDRYYLPDMAPLAEQAYREEAAPTNASAYADIRVRRAPRLSKSCTLTACRYVTSQAPPSAATPSSDSP